MTILEYWSHPDNSKTGTPSRRKALKMLAHLVGGLMTQTPLFHQGTPGYRKVLEMPVHRVHDTRGLMNHRV